MSYSQGDFCTFACVKRLELASGQITKHSGNLVLQAGGGEVCLKERPSIQNYTQQETTATRRLSAHYGQNERTEKEMARTQTGSCHLKGD